MKPTTTAKIGIGVIGIGIIGYGLYSMKKDTEKLLEGPSKILGGLFGPDSVLGGGGLPDGEVIRKAGSTAKSSFIDGLMDGLSISLGLGLPPSAVKTESGNLPFAPANSIFVGDIKSHQQAASLGLGMAPLAVNTQSDFKKSSDIYFPALEASPTTKYTEKSSSGSANSYTDSTGRTYTPTNTIKAKW